MGDRVSISFRNGDQESVALFSHWDGMEFVTEARAYVHTLQKQRAGRHELPLDRMEPATVMANYLSRFNSPIASNYYLGRDGDDGDNSDNGHHVIPLDGQG